MNFEKVLNNMLTHEERGLLDEIRIELRREVEERERVEYLKGSIRLDIEGYRDLLNEERGLCRELSMTRGKLEEGANDEYLMGLIEGIRHEISENTGVQIVVLANIHKNLRKLKKIN